MIFMRVLLSSAQFWKRANPMHVDIVRSAIMRITKMLFFSAPKLFLQARARDNGMRFVSRGQWFFLKLCEVMPLLKDSKTVSFL